MTNSRFTTGGNPLPPLKIKADLPIVTYKNNPAGGWEVTVKMNGMLPLTETEMSKLRQAMSEVSFYLEQWRQRHVLDHMKRGDK